MHNLDKHPRCKAYLAAMNIMAKDDGWTDYYLALSVAESFPDSTLEKFGGLDFWNMEGGPLLKRMEEFLENRAKSKPNAPPKQKKNIAIGGKTTITEAEIIAAMTPKGGWKRATLDSWGVPWPPPKGWRKQIVTHGIPFSFSRK